MTASARPGPRHRRARPKPSRRRRITARRRRIVRGSVLTAMIAGGVFWVADTARRTPRLRVDTITVAGNDRLSTGEALALVATLRGENILDADLERNRDRLLASGWVAGAVLRRVFPSTIDITLTEREPVGLGRFGSRLYLVDPAGRVIDEFGPRFADLDLPIIDGLSGDPGAGNRQVDGRRAALAARLLAEVGMDPGLSVRLSQVDVADPRDAVVLLNGDPALIHLGDERFAARLRTYLELKPSLRARVPDVDYVDLRFDRRVYVRPAGREELAEAHDLARWHREPAQ